MDAAHYSSAIPSLLVGSSCGVVKISTKVLVAALACSVPLPLLCLLQMLLPHRPRPRPSSPPNQQQVRNANHPRHPTSRSGGATLKTNPTQTSPPHWPRRSHPLPPRTTKTGSTHTTKQIAFFSFHVTVSASN